MADIRLEDEGYRAEGLSRVLAANAADERKGLVGWLIKRRIAKNERTAELILVSVAAVILSVAVYLFMHGRSSPSSPLPAGAKIIYPTGAPPRLEAPINPQ